MAADNRPARIAAMTAAAALLVVSHAGAVCGVPARPGGASSPTAALNPADVESFMDGLMADQLETAHVAGAVVAIVEKGNIVLAKGYGYADIAARKRVDAATTLFRPGSVSKLFTFTAVMQLVEQGKVDLDTDINHYLKSFKVPDTYPQHITLRHLITHTAGFENINAQLFAPDGDSLLPLPDALRKYAPRRVRPPGMYSSYSNYGVALAGLIVEEVSGMSFDAYIERNIFRPLGMSNATFREPLPEQLAAQMSQGYVYFGGAFIPPGFEYLHDFAPAGSASVTAVGMAKFMIAHLQDGEYGGARILREDTARRMHSRLFANDGRLPGLAYGFNEGSINGCGFLAHRGDTHWFHSDLHLLLDSDIGIFVSYNTPLAANQREALLQAFMDRYFPRTRANAIAPPPDFAAHAGRYTGGYQSMSRSYTTFEKFDEFFGGARRTISLTPQNTLLLDAGYVSLQLAEVSPDRFREVDGDTEVVFHRDAGGGTRFFISSSPATTMEKLSRWTDPALQRFLLALCMLVSLVFLWTAFTGRREARNYSRSRRWARWSMSAVCLLNIVFCFTFIALYVTQQNYLYLYGLPVAMKLLLLLPLAAAIVTATLPFFAVLAWVQPRRSVKASSQYTVAMLAALFMVWFTQHYNLVGFPLN